MSNEVIQNEIDKMDTPLPLWVILIIPTIFIVLMSLVFFVITQDWAWIEAWLFLTTFTINIGVSYYLINKKNPRVIRNRMNVKKVGITDKTKKSAGSDRYILPFLSIGLVGAMILPAFDYRYQWTSIPFPVEILGLVIMNIGLIVMEFAMVQNAYASKILDINKDQKLIDTGLYAHVRHPLYTGFVLWVLGMPIVLGSWISLIFAAIGVIVIMIRIRFEEEMLIKGLEGYVDYRKSVKYKLIPKIY